VLLIHSCGLWVLLMYVSRSVVCGDRWQAGRPSWVL